MTRMPVQKKTQDEIREETLRPCPQLGYDRDNLAIYLIGRGGYAIAESQLRRAIWLNPFEPMFKEHLALCLLRQKRLTAAKTWIDQALAQNPNSGDARRILGFIIKD